MDMERTNGIVKNSRVITLVVSALMFALCSSIVPVYADNLGTTSVAGFATVTGPGYIRLQQAKAGSTGGPLASIRIFTTGASGSDTGRVAIYADSSGSVGSKLGESDVGTLTTGTGVETVFTSGTLTSVTITANAYYWLAFQVTGSSIYYSYGVTGKIVYSAAVYGPFPNTLTGTYSDNTAYGIYAIYTTGPPAQDFTISASPTSQTVGGGSSTSYTLTLTASSTYGGGTVSLTVTSGLPSGATGTITLNSISLAASETKTATLSVSTSITTPGGTSSIVVTATNGTKPHTVTVGLTVIPPPSYSFNVKASATQIVVTLTYSWSGSGSPPLGSITIAGPNGTPTLSESGAVVYDRTSITVSGITSTYSIIHRATFTITAPGSAQVWTAYVSLAGVSSYNVAIEVS